MVGLSMAAEPSRDLEVFALQSQLRQARKALKHAERELIKERLSNSEFSRKVRLLLLRSFRVVNVARQWVDANAFGEGDTDAAWLQLYQSICDWDEAVKDELGEEE